ncbi:hypothetical protein AMK59_2061 [Oryctes borbonicus]|uniref:Hemolymph juvenile hormone-binding protein n=1 Tax=Oryctes borbonicus TaxID=1629725 RepID=A0A0T6BGF7_9SCAR|nr:hypothetical protein AMK59_2061 [Oryctes borbonicus]
MDSVLNSVNTALTSSNKTVLEIPALTFYIGNEKSRRICNTGIGRLENLSFKRIEDIGFYECDNIQHVYGYIRLTDFQFNYPSFTVNDEIGDKGSIEVGAYRNKIFVRLSIQKVNDLFKMEVDKVQAVKILDIDFNTNNLERIAGYFGQLQDCILGIIYGTVFPLLEQTLQRELTRAITNI